MAEDNFDPFEEDYAGVDHQPRVRQPYASTSAHARPTSRLRSFIASLSFTRERVILIGKAALVALFILAYPIMTVMSHQINDSPVVFDDKRYWAVSDIGVTSILIARELDGPGWVSDRHPWHPQARLTALPAWQESLLTCLADHGRLVISELNTLRDQDLIAAVRLLEPSGQQNMRDRLIAASEALARYDDRVAGGVAASPSGLTAMIARLNLSGGWADQNHARLVDVASPGDGWIASREAIEAVYAAKAAAHVAHEILANAAQNEPTLQANHQADAAMQDALAKWRRAAKINPLFISNQSGDGMSGLSHPAIMAFHLSEARLANQVLIAQFQKPVKETAPETAEEIARLEE